MKKHTTSTAIPTYALKAEALASMSASFERFCLAAGLETLSEMLEQDATAACGERHERGERRQAHRWGRTKGKIGFHGGKVEIERPRVRGLDGVERVLPSWENAVSEDLLGKWAMNQMLINVSTRRFKRSVRLPEGDVPASDGAGLSKSATSRRFVALSAARMKAWMETRLDDLDLLAIQIDGIHMDEDMLLVAAIGVDANGDKHPLGLVEGATENATTVQALIDNLVERGLDPTVRRLFIIDGAKALSKAIRRTFGRDAAIQRCQIHKARNILERLPKSMHASVRRVLRQAWEMDDAERAETLMRAPAPLAVTHSHPTIAQQGTFSCCRNRGHFDCVLTAGRRVLPGSYLRPPCGNGLEGIASKRIDLSYRPGRSADRLKAKCVQSDIFVIVGYQPDDRDRVANLKSATRDADGSLHYFGAVDSL